MVSNLEARASWKREKTAADAASDAAPDAQAGASDAVIPARVSGASHRTHRAPRSGRTGGRCRRHPALCHAHAESSGRWGASDGRAPDASDAISALRELSGAAPDARYLQRQRDVMRPVRASGAGAVTVEKQRTLHRTHRRCIRCNINLPSDHSTVTDLTNDV